MPLTYSPEDIDVVVLCGGRGTRLKNILVDRPKVMALVNSQPFLDIVLNYAANLAPRVEVNRCVFIYHYMSALVFAFLAIAWFVDRCLYSYYKELRALGVTITFLILIAFVFWMPIYLGLPLSPQDYQLRMWFNSWI